MTLITWLAEDNPLPALEKGWQQNGRLSVQDIGLLEENRRHNADARVRERCRVLLAAINNRNEADPHVQKLTAGRTRAQFREKVRPRASTPRSRD